MTAIQIGALIVLFLFVILTYWAGYHCGRIDGHTEGVEEGKIIQQSDNSQIIQTLELSLEQARDHHRPTPMRSDGADGTGNQGRKGGLNLRTAVARTWPTPVASMAKGSSQSALTRKSGADRSNDRLDHAVMASDGGQLNPEWVEWLMGWPIRWTDLRPLAMDRFQGWRRQHLICFSQTRNKDIE